MRLLLTHVRAQTVELLRFPAYSVPTLAFPTLLFLLFAAPSDSADPEVAVAGFAAIAVLGVVFFQFGVGIAAERANPWEAFLRVLPLAPRTRVAARLVSALLFATVSVLVLLAAALATTDVEWSGADWASFAAALAVGAVPFALFGIALGYLVPARAALPVANLLFLPLSFLGGLWGGAEHLPDTLRSISRFLPTRQWGELLGSGTGDPAWALRDLLALAAYAVCFALVAGWAYRRDEGERYR
jgi:ABC-2 type transport system permease protein